jgi:MFS family permease
MQDIQRPSSNWPILVLLALTGTLVASLEGSCMPVLFEEISHDLGLNLVEIGMIWGMSYLPAVLVSIAGGLLSDRFGIRRILILFCVIAGITCALRGLSNSFLTLTVFVFLNGAARMVIPVTLTKAIGLWFKGPKLGTAMGVLMMGAGLGLMLGPAISATVLSPLLGGWRNVLFFYGAVGILVGMVWAFWGKEPAPAIGAGLSHLLKVPARVALSRLLHIRKLWLISASNMFRMGCAMGVTGFLPLYLLSQGWETAAADSALSTFFIVSSGSVLMWSFISDRLGSRKAILYLGAVLMTASSAILPFVEGAAVWVMVILAGITFDAFVAIGNTMLLEGKEISSDISGLAFGISIAITHTGSFVSPPIGNSFERFGPGVPFFFWAGLSAVSLLILFAIPEKRRNEGG